MAMTKCTECGKDISTDAETCPSCGKKVAKKKMGLVGKLVLGLFGLFVIGTIASAGKSSSTPGASAASSASSSTAPEPEQPAMAVTAAALFRAYDKNEVAADDIYKGKRLAVTGTVESIDKDFMDNIVVHLSAGQMFMNVMATVKDSQKSAAAGLSKRQQISLRCTGAGRILTSPVLHDCLIE